jgi:hypothetical protein
MFSEVDEVESHSSRNEISQAEATDIIASLEPGQLASAKARSHCPRRKLTGTEAIFFWALRAYLIFMFGVVMYQLWTVAR